MIESTAKKLARSLSIALVALFLILGMPAPVIADGAPQLPALYWGTVKIDSGTGQVDAPIGTVITAKVNDVERGRITVTEPGKYGGPTALDSKLIVQGDITQGSLVKFYVNNVQADQTATFQNDHPEETNLTAYIPAGGGGGGGGFGGGGGTANQTAKNIETNLFGNAASFPISSDGKIIETLKATSEDSKLTVTIPQGTKMLDKNGDPLQSLEISIDESPPSPPENTQIIGLAYDFSPEGAIFAPPITFVCSYDPDTLPEEIAEEDLVIAYYDENTNEWVALPCTLDPATHTITARVNHFTTFATIGRTALVPPLPPTPAVFLVTSLSVEPLEVQPNETVTIIVLVANTGGSEGSSKVVLKINGLTEAEQSVAIAAGGSKAVTFFVTKEESGSYTVAVGDLTGSFTVVVATPSVPSSEPPAEETTKTLTNWPVIGGIIAAVVIVGLLIFLIVFRRRAV